MFIRRLKSSERKRLTSSAGVGWTLGGLRQASLVAGEAGEAVLKDAEAEVSNDLSYAMPLTVHAGLRASARIKSCDLSSSRPTTHSMAAFFAVVGATGRGHGRGAGAGGYGAANGGYAAEG